MTSSHARARSAPATPPPPSVASVDPLADAVAGRRLARGAGFAVGLFAAAVGVAHLPGVDVHAGPTAPLFADWGPRVGPGTIPALALVVWAATAGPWRWAQRLSWGRLLWATWGLSVAWMLSLALVDGTAGVGAVLVRPSEYLESARSVDDVGALLHSFTSRIPLSANDNWPIHVAGHPPGALLFFVALSRVGLGSGLAAGLVVVAVAATIPVAVAVTGRAVGEQATMRVVLPFLVLGPFAVWQAVSADAVFAAAAAWTVAFAALAGASRSGRAGMAWGAACGVGLGGCALLSYGLVLVAVVVLAAVVAARGWTTAAARLVAVVAVGGGVVLAAFAAAGFAYWEASPVLHQRYWDGLASARPAAYWVWANLAVLALCAGPLLFGSLAVLRGRLATGVRHQTGNPLLALVAGAVIAVLAADLSLMSKAEVERIWLPFVPWLLVSTMVVPVRWRRVALLGQASLGLLVQSLLVTPW